MGALLAGGASRRFGTPKGLATVGGERIIDRAAHALRSATESLLLVANDVDAGGWLEGATLVRDAIPGGGGLSGVHAALVRAQAPVLVVAWDMPFVSGALLREVARRCTDAHADAAVPESDSPVGMEPFCACYAPSCLPALERALNAGTTGGAQFVRSLPHVAWFSTADAASFGDPSRLYFSVNTPDDLRRAQAMVASAN